MRTPRITGHGVRVNFPVLDQQSAPSESQPVMARARERMGFVPHLVGMLAASPPAVTSYVLVADALKLGSLSATEQQVVALAVSTANRCQYCVAAHSAAALTAGMPREVLCDLRDDVALGDPRLEALRLFTRSLLASAGMLDPGEIEGFLAVGFTPAHALEVITIIAHKTLSNLANNLARTPVDAAFAFAARA